eukprot:SAG31_NODE_1333_length_8743_cov_1.681050_2_plen_148_part_00
MATDKPLLGGDQPYAVVAKSGDIIPAEHTFWSQDLFEDFGIGCRYTMCPCCCGAPAAVAKVDVALADVGGVVVMGMPCGGFCCWCCCGLCYIRGARVAMRKKYNLRGPSNMTISCCIDMWLGDNCPGCALRQMEAHVEAYECKPRST